MKGDTKTGMERGRGTRIWKHEPQGMFHSFSYFYFINKYLLIENTYVHARAGARDVSDASRAPRRYVFSFLSLSFRLLMNIYN